MSSFCKVTMSAKKQHYYYSLPLPLLLLLPPLLLLLLRLLLLLPPPPPPLPLPLPLSLPQPLVLSLLLLLLVLLLLPYCYFCFYFYFHVLLLWLSLFLLLFLSYLVQILHFFSKLLLARSEQTGLRPPLPRARAALPRPLTSSSQHACSYLIHAASAGCTGHAAGVLATWSVGEQLDSLSATSAPICSAEGVDRHGFFHDVFHAIFHAALMAGSLFHAADAAPAKGGGKGKTYHVACMSGPCSLHVTS